MSCSLFSSARDCLVQTSIKDKLEQTTCLQNQWQSGALDLSKKDVTNYRTPGMPDNLIFVEPAKLPRRSLHDAKGHAAFIHALTHIEFSAINLALDIIARFQTLPARFYDDWTRVAAEEARHFGLLQSRLSELGYEYGDFPVHNGLWDTAEKTAHDILLRLALVPRMLEARGLDVTPAMINRLHEINDEQTAKLLQQILEDEIGHVSIGSHWFNFVCAERGIDSQSTYLELIRNHAGTQIRKPINYEARKSAGFGEKELSELELMTK